MKSIKATFISGFIIWLIPFLISFFIFQIHENDRVLFETLMALILVTTIVGVLTRYVKINRLETAKEAGLVSLVWMLENLLLDTLVFIWGPLKMDPIGYVKDIGLMYVLILIITVGLTKMHTLPTKENTMHQAS